MFHKTTQYALRALVYILIENSEGNLPGFRKVAREIGSPIEFTGKILQELVRKKILSSIKGKKGGFYLTELQKHTSLKTIIESIEGGQIFHGCGFGLDYCDANNPCPLHNGYAEIRNELLKYVSRYTINDLAYNASLKKHIINRKLV